MLGIVIQLLSGLASPEIFVPSFLVGWFVGRWWQVALGALVVAGLSEAEVMLIELPGAEPDWAWAPMVVIAPLAWCIAGFLMRAWYQRTTRLRPGGPIRSLPVLAGMVAGGIAVGALALAVGLFYLKTGELEYHSIQFGRAPGGADYETIFFRYLFPGLLLGQLAGGLIGRVLGRPRASPPA